MNLDLRISKRYSINNKFLFNKFISLDMRISERNAIHYIPNITFLFLHLKMNLMF